MNIQDILTAYDSMFGRCTLQEIEAFLLQNISNARACDDKGVQFTLLNELVGFYRDTTQREKGLLACGELWELLEQMGIKGRVEYATALLNIANAYRAFGLFKESQELFQKVQGIYLEKLEKTNFGYAELYNNWSLLYQETENYEKAVELLERALVVTEYYEEAVIKQAVTKTNLAATLLKIQTPKAYKRAIAYLKDALEVFEKDGGRDFHYGAALVAMGDACSYVGNYDEASKYYLQGLGEIEKHTGKNENYQRVLEKYYYSKSRGQSNLDRSRAFYEEWGRAMIHELFPEYEERIAVGMVGEGSDCFGFDDEISADHDYGVGFCMWLTGADYEQVGEALQRAYDELCKKVRAQTGVNRFLQGRRGVFTIDGFYNGLLGGNCAFEQGEEILWDGAEEFLLATVTNGAVFRDDLGIFSRVRKELLAYYPETVWRRRLAGKLHEYAQYGQSNYARMMVRKDYVTAEICAGKAVESAMDVAYLLERRFAPYYKWKRKGLEVLADKGKVFFVKKLLELLEQNIELPLQKEAWRGEVYSSVGINTKDGRSVLFEEIAGVILEEMKRCGLVSGEDLFLENYVNDILSGKTGQIQDGEGKEKAMNIVEKIVELEWEQFDKVKNEGGRADCQDNFGTFSIMRKSQYLAWGEDVLQSYYVDLMTAKQSGRNLITEKYARMMESTCPEKYATFAHELPPISKERIEIQEGIIEIQVAWMEDFASKYPKMAQNARSIHTEEDNAYNTSYETYLRGELCTYSEETFILYSRFVIGLLKAGRNLAHEIMENTAKLYGYESVEDAEQKLS